MGLNVSISRVPFFAPAAAALLLTACAADVSEVGPERVETASSEPSESASADNGETPDSLAVIGGKPSAQCSWPSTVDVGGCTGTLIHPRVITTAGHCIRTASTRITFTAGRGVAGSFAVTGRCVKGSALGGAAADWAYCVLPEDERVKRMPITPPLVGCEAQKYLKAGANAWVVGFGETAPKRGDYGTKREVEVKVNGAANNTINIGDRNVGACHGDSGGPLYMRLTDGTRDFGWRVLGSTSRAAEGRCDCTCATLYVNIAQHVKAIETNEKIDVTPCTDANGAWAPSDQCKEFQAAPNQGTGTYPTCSIAKTQGPIETCGPNPYGAITQP